MLKGGRDVIMKGNIVRGRWREGSEFASETTSAKGVPHDTIIDERILNNPEIQQLNNAITTKLNCHEKDSSVVVVSKVANTMSNGGNRPEYSAWKYTFVTGIDVVQHMDIKRLCTPEETTNVNDTTSHITPPLFVREGYSQTMPFFRIVPQEKVSNNTEYKEEILCFPRVTKNPDIKYITAPEKLLAITAQPKPLAITAEPKPLCLPLSSAENPILMSLLTTHTKPEMEFNIAAYAKQCAAEDLQKRGLNLKINDTKKNEQL